MAVKKTNNKKFALRISLGLVMLWFGLAAYITRQLNIPDQQNLYDQNLTNTYITFIWLGPLVPLIIYIVFSLDINKYFSLKDSVISKILLALIKIFTCILLLYFIYTCYLWQAFNI